MDLFVYDASSLVRLSVNGTQPSSTLRLTLFRLGLGLPFRFGFGLETVILYNFLYRDKI